jgi:hypothetical protein
MAAPTKKSAPMTPTAVALTLMALGKSQQTTPATAKTIARALIISMFPRRLGERAGIRFSKKMSHKG